MTALHIDTTKRRLYLYMSADVLLTTDIKFLKGCHKIDLKVEVKNPVEFVMEVFGMMNQTMKIVKIRLGG